MKKKLLVVGDTLALPGGLAYIAGMFTKYFIQSNDFEVAYACITGIKCEAEKITAIEDKNIFIKNNITVYNIDQKDQTKDFKRIVAEFNPQIVFTVHDPWVLEVVAFNEFRPSYFWIAYTTIESPDYGDKIYQPSLLGKNYRSIPGILEKADLVVPVTQMGKKVMTEKYKLKNVLNDNVYNGVETEMECTKEIDKNTLFDGHLLENQFLFATVGLNSERKKHERVLMAFARFLKMIRNPDRFKLYLHTNIYSSLGGPDLAEVINNLGIGQNVIALGHDNYITKERLYKIYKAIDCYVMLSGAEGFCLPAADSMLHSKPIIYIDWGGHAEFACNGGLAVKVEDYVYAMRMGYKLALGDIDDCAKKMFKLATDDKLRKKLGENGHKFVMENLDWKIIFAKLISYIIPIYEQSDFKEFYGLKIKRLI